MNRTAEIINRLSDLESNGLGPFVLPATNPEHIQVGGGGRIPSSFDVKSIEANNITIRQGRIRYDGDAIGVYPIGDTTVEIQEGPTQWIAVCLTRSGSPVASVGVYASEPVSDGSAWYWPLYTVHLNDDGNAVVEQDWRTDIRIGSPIG